MGRCVVEMDVGVSDQPPVGLGFWVLRLSKTTCTALSEYWATSRFMKPGNPQRLLRW